MSEAPQDVVAHLIEVVVDGSLFRVRVGKPKSGCRGLTYRFPSLTYRLGEEIPDRLKAMSLVSRIKFEFPTPHTHREVYLNTLPTSTLDDPGNSWVDFYELKRVNFGTSSWIRDMFMFFMASDYYTRITTPTRETA